MTKKDYIRLARALARTRPSGHEDNDSPEYAAWVAVRNAIADTLGDENERFARGTFLVATDAVVDGRS